MELRFSPKTEARINNMVADGDFPDADAVIDEALDLLEERRRLLHLRELLAVGAEQAARGEVGPFDDAFRDEAKRDAVDRYAKGERAGPDARP